MDQGYVVSSSGPPAAGRYEYITHYGTNFVCSSVSDNVSDNVSGVRPFGDNPVP